MLRYKNRIKLTYERIALMPKPYHEKEEELFDKSVVLEIDPDGDIDFWQEFRGFLNACGYYAPEGEWVADEDAADREESIEDWDGSPLNPEARGIAAEDAELAERELHEPDEVCGEIGE